MAIRKARLVQVGDRFMKADERFGKTWEVSRVWTTVGSVPHARLKGLEDQSEMMTISVITLTDPQFFSPVLAKLAAE